MRGFQSWLCSLDNLWWPLFHLQWVQKLRVINQLWPMRLIALMLLIVAGDVELNPGPTGSSPHSPTTTPDTSCISMSATLCNRPSYHQLEVVASSSVHALVARNRSILGSRYVNIVALLCID